VLENNAREGVSADHERGVEDSGGAAERAAFLQNSQSVDRQQLQPASTASAS